MASGFSRTGPGSDRTGRLRVSVTDASGRRIRDGGLSAWLTSVAPARASGDLAIALVTDSRMRALNQRFRGADKTTDVLSFTGDLGDIVIAKGVAQRQAREAGHSFQAELRVLALHGLLHLLGYDHHSRHDNGRMARIEARLRRKGGLRTGLIERALG
jgi:probable rRNA maturation factor